MLPALQPWEKIAWSPEEEQIIYRDWGQFFTCKQHLDAAADYYNKALELKPDDAPSLLARSSCKRNIAQTEGALEDALEASKLDAGNAPIRLAICDALYQLNQFENSKIELHDNARKFQGRKVAAFLNRIDVVDENFRDTIGESLSPFILQNEKKFYTILEELELSRSIDKRPLWKILKEQHKCDVLSVLEKEEILLSPREIARRERAFRVFNQIYFDRSWIDVLFLKALRDNPHLMIEQSKVSTPFLKHLTSSKYEIIKRFLKMLHARSPLYNERAVKCPDKKVWERHCEANLNRVQYQTRRNMLTILRTIRHLRAMGRVQKLSRYIEEVMGDYVVVKTHRVMPWKFEFINEVYNTLALAHADCYTVPPNYLTTTSPKNLSILKLLHVGVDKTKDRAMTFVFGDRSSYQDPEAVDSTLVANKKFVARLEKRLHFAKHSIEKCYLYHEMARSYLNQNRFDECCSVARKAFEETKNCNSDLWQFLSSVLICKSHAILHKVERAKEVLEEAYTIATRLKSPHLCEFIDVCRSINEHELMVKKRIQSNESVVNRRNRRSKMSLSSRFSHSFNDEGEDEETPDDEQTTSRGGGKSARSIHASDLASAHESGVISEYNSDHLPFL